MTKLKRLNQEANRFISKSFMKHGTALPDAVTNYIEELERDISLTSFDAKLDEIMDTTEPYDPVIDQLAAPHIHRTLNLTRREAADQGIWRFLAVIHRDDFVRHRWRYTSKAAMERRFFRGQKAWNTNTFSRLWWVAELTSQYSDNLTRRVLERQSLAQAIFERYFGKYPPAIKAFTAVFEDKSADVIAEAAKEFDKKLSLLVLESQTLNEIRQHLKELYRRICVTEQ